MPLQARTEFAAALNQVASEKGVDIKVVVDAIEQAALAAFRKDLSLRGEEIPEDFDTLIAKINPASGEIAIMRETKNITPPGFARIAAQTAKQVILQKLREAEKGAIMDEYDKKVSTVLSGTITRQEGSTFFVDLGRAEGVMPYPEQSRDEYYHLGQRLKVFVKEIREGGRGPEVVVSRTDTGLVKGLFAMEVPEIQAGTVEIKELAREAGGRTKVAAVSTQEGIDPVGSLVGQKGVRVQAVMNELGEEKIDIIPYSEDPIRYIASALSPAKDPEVTLNEKEKIAKVKLPSSQLSLAIGKGGQNVRLAAKLTGWKIDIEGLEEPTSVKEASNFANASSDKSDDKPSKEFTEEAKAGTSEKKEVPAQTPSDQAQITSQPAADAVDKTVEAPSSEEEAPAVIDDAKAVTIIEPSIPESEDKDQAEKSETSQK